MFVNESAEAIGPLAKRGKESVLGLGFDVMKKRWSKYAITLVHQTLLIIVVHIDITVGFLPNIVAMGVFSSCIIRKFFNCFEDNLINKFALIGKKMLNTVVFGGNQSLRPIDINGLVIAHKNRIKVVTINDALVIQTGIVEAVLVLVLNQ